MFNIGAVQTRMVRWAFGFVSSLIRLYNRAFAAMSMRSTEIMTQHVRFVQLRKKYRNRSMIFQGWRKECSETKLCMLVIHL